MLVKSVRVTEGTRHLVVEKGAILRSSRFGRERGYCSSVRMRVYTALA